MSKLHVYIKPFDANGVYVPDFIEVTNDVSQDGLGTLNQQLDNTAFDIGIFRNSFGKLKLRNDHGFYSEVGNTNSIFNHTRSNSLLRITWEPGDGPLICGFFKAGVETILSEEIEIFTGFLNDRGTKSDISDQLITFDMLGKAAIFGQTRVPFASLSAGDLTSLTLFKLLNQTKITDLLIVDAANISVSIDSTIDTKASMDGELVLEALKRLLGPANAVLYIKNDTVFISPRTPTVSSQFTFFGHGSANGIENIISIKSIRSGVQRVLNYVRWQNTNLVAEDTGSTTKYGIFEKSISSSFFTNSTKRNNSIGSIRDEFSDPKQEFELVVPLNVDTLPLFLLDKITIDYPAILYPDESDSLPVYNIAQYDIARYPLAETALEISTAETYKIMSRKLNFKQEMIEYSMRQI